MELYSPEGLRVDGRRWNELRRFECRLNTHPNSLDGSAYVEQGNTKVMAMVHGPKEPPLRSQQDQSKAVIEVGLNVANFSTIDRKKRGKTEKRMLELKTTLERTFEQSIVSHVYARNLIEIQVHVLAQDGGLLASITNAITLALIDAGVAMYDYIAAVNVGLFDQSPLLDLCTLEENDMSSMTVGVVGESEKLAMVLLEDKMALDSLESILGLAIAGAHSVRELMDSEVRKHGSRRVAKQARA